MEEQNVLVSIKSINSKLSRLLHLEANKMVGSDQEERYVSAEIVDILISALVNLSKDNNSLADKIDEWRI